MKVNIQQRYLVLVRCITFNHANYIEDAMNGFCMQQTSFPFVCTIIDDFSSDGEQEVIRRYLQEQFDLDDQSVVRNEETDDYFLTFARHKTNYNCFFAVYFLKYNHYSVGKSTRKNDYIKEWIEQVKYIALCEGDDFWTDPYKLQKQVDYMEAHPECMMCCSNGIWYSETSKESWRIDPLPVDHSRIVTPHEVFCLENPLIPTCSMCYRSEMLMTMPEFFKNAPVGDRPIRMWCAINGTIFYHTEPMITYRAGAVGCYTDRVKQNIKYAENIYEGMCIFFDEFDKYTNYTYQKDVDYMKNREAYVFYTNTANFRKIITAKHLQTYSFVKRTSIRMKCLVKLIPGIYPLYLRFRKQ